MFLIFVAPHNHLKYHGFSIDADSYLKDLSKLHFFEHFTYYLYLNFSTI